ncbi:MAG: hypothetical protein V4494_02385 [Chlamydiota bacterium]
MFIESISRPFKKCLRETTLTRESLTEHYELVWRDISWEFGWFSRELTAHLNEDEEKYPDQTDDFDIRFCQDYRTALSLIYEDLDLLHDNSRAQNLKNIVEHERANLKNFEELKSCNIDLPLQTRKSDKQEILAEIKSLERSIKRRQEQIVLYQEWILSDEVKYAGFFKDVEKAEKKINTIWFSQLDWCLENHEHPNAFYERGMLHFC